jgi:hypothetical protein
VGLWPAGLYYENIHPIGFFSVVKKEHDAEDEVYAEWNRLIAYFSSKEIRVERSDEPQLKTMFAKC